MSRLGILGRPGVGRLGIAGLLSETGDWMLFIALPVFVLQLTGSTMVTATVFALELLPTVLLGPLAGALVDRWHPWRLMTTVVVLQAVALLPLLLVHSAAQLWIVYLVVLVESVLGTVVEPARSATGSRLVTSAELPAVNQLFGVLSALARLVGGPIGGLLLGLSGLPGILIGDGATFLAAGALLVTGWNSRVGVPATVATTSVRRDWVEGLSIVSRTSVLRRSLVVAGVMGLAQGGFVVLFVLFVIRDLGGDAADVGVLRGVQAIGAVVGGLLLALVVRRISAERLVGFSLLAFGVLSLASWNGPLLTTAFGLYVGLFIAVGVPGIGSLTGLMTILQRAAPEHARGRVLSCFFAVFGGVQALGMLVAGLVGTGVGLTIALQIQGCLYLVAGVIAFGLRSGRSDQRQQLCGVAGQLDSSQPVHDVPQRDRLIEQDLAMGQQTCGNCGAQLIVTERRADEQTQRISLRADPVPQPGGASCVRDGGGDGPGVVRGAVVVGRVGAAVHGGHSCERGRAHQ